jgi:acetyltransferase
MYERLFRDHGILLAGDVFRFMSGCKALTLAPLPRGNRVGLITVTGGGNVIILDHLIAAGCRLGRISTKTEKEIYELLGGKAPVRIQNPLDLTMVGFQTEIIIRAMEALLADPEVDLLISMIPIHPHHPFPFAEVTRLQRQSTKPVILCWVLQNMLSEGFRQQQWELQANGVPVYLTVEQAAWGVGYLVQYVQSRNRLENG